MNTTDQANLSASLALITRLESLILSQAATTYGPADGHAYSVAISKMRAQTGDECEARLVVYAGGTGSEWRVLLANPRLCESPVDAVADLLERVYEEAGKAVGGAVEGARYGSRVQC